MASSKQQPPAAANGDLQEEERLEDALFQLNQMHLQVRNLP
jgi:hypothetical protein